MGCPAGLETFILSVSFVACAAIAGLPSPLPPGVIVALCTGALSADVAVIVVLERCVACSLM